MNSSLPIQEHNDAIMLAVLPVSCALILMSRPVHWAVQHLSIFVTWRTVPQLGWSNKCTIVSDFIAISVEMLEKFENLQQQKTLENILALTLFLSSVLMIE